MKTLQGFDFARAQFVERALRLRKFEIAEGSRVIATARGARRFLGARQQFPADHDSFGARARDLALKRQGFALQFAPGVDQIEIGGAPFGGGAFDVVLIGVENR